MFTDEGVILGEPEEGTDTLVVDEKPAESIPIEDASLDENGNKITETVEVEKPAADVPETSWFDTFKKETGTEFENIDTLKEALKPKENPEYETLKAKHERLIEEVKKIQNPKDYFNNDTDAKKYQFLKEHPTVSGEAAGKLFSLDLDKSNPLDIIAVDLMMNHKSLSSEEVAKNWFLRKQGIDPEDYNWDDLDEFQKTDINIAAENAVKNITSLRNSVVMPDSKTIDDILSDVKPFDMKQWDGKVENLVSSVKEMKIEDEGLVYSEKIGDDFRKEVTEFINAAIKQDKLEPTEENIKNLGKQAMDVYFLENKNSIIKRIVDQEVKKAKEDFHKQIHNDADPDKMQMTKPKGQGKTTNLLTVFGIPE